MWVEMSAEMRQLALKTKPQLVKIANDRGIKNIDSSLNKKEFREELVANLSGDYDDGLGLGLGVLFFFVCEWVLQIRFKDQYQLGHRPTR